MMYGTEGPPSPLASSIARRLGRKAGKDRPRAQAGAVDKREPGLLPGVYLELAGSDLVRIVGDGLDDVRAEVGIVRGEAYALGLEIEGEDLSAGELAVPDHHGHVVGATSTRLSWR